MSEHFRSYAPSRGDLMRLRVRLWANHEHDGKYGDDGELQCSRCGLDFRRDDFETILERLDMFDLERAGAALMGNSSE